jgi:DNA-binding beta-propeller fold protein YncE
VKHAFVDSTRYNTVSMVRTIEAILKIKPLNLNDAHAMPMLDAFDVKQAEWYYTATPSAYLAKTGLPIPAEKFSKAALDAAPTPLHDAAWWTEQCKGMDFSVEDHLDSVKFNHVLWVGTMGTKPYPDARSGEDLRGNRQQLLEGYREAPRRAVSDSGGR